MISGLNDLKKQIFYDLLQLAGRVYIHVRHSERVLIGKRGFLPEEVEKGLVLVFNPQMKFTWDDSGISATLVFGATPQKCFIPSDEILAVFSPELQAQFSVVPPAGGKEGPVSASEKPDMPSEDEKVVRVDFRKKKQK